MIKFFVNNKAVSVDESDRDMPLLWLLRDSLALTGTKFGCGIGECGACTVHLNGRAIRSCSVPIAALQGQKVTTIEGLASDGKLHPVQQAWQDHDVPQCGYCQPGQIMAATAFLSQHAEPSDEDIDKGISNICRCGTYPRIRKAIKTASIAIKQIK